MPDELEALRIGIAWLAAGGREHALLVEKLWDDNQQFVGDLEEAIEWLNSINDSENV